MSTFSLKNIRFELLSLGDALDTPRFELKQNRYNDFLLTKEDWAVLLNLRTASENFRTIDDIFTFLLESEHCTLKEEHIESFTSFIQALSFERSSYIGFMITKDQISSYVQTISYERPLSKKHEDYFKKSRTAYTVLEENLESVDSYKYKQLEIRTWYDTVNGSYSWRKETRWSKDFFDFEILRYIDSLLIKIAEYKKEYINLCYSELENGPKTEYVFHSYRKVFQDYFRREHITLPSDSGRSDYGYIFPSISTLSTSTLGVWKRIFSNETVKDEIVNFFSSDLYEIINKVVNKFELHKLSNYEVSFNRSNLLTYYKDYLVYTNPEYAKYIPLIILEQFVVTNKRSIYSNLITEILTEKEIERIFEYQSVFDVVIRSIDDFNKNKEKQQKTV